MCTFAANFHDDVYTLIDNRKARSAWARGVKEYAKEFADSFLELNNICVKLNNGERIISNDFLNGASSWEQYSYCGCALIYDGDIAERLCTPSELKKKKGGDLMPNSWENWLNVQARALRQAARIAANAINQAAHKAGAKSARLTA